MLQNFNILGRIFLMNGSFVERLFIQLNDCSMCVCCVSTQCRRNSVCNFRSLISCQPVDAKWYNYNNRYKMQISKCPNAARISTINKLSFKLNTLFCNEIVGIILYHYHSSILQNWRKLQKMKSCKCQFWNWTHKIVG